MNLNRRNLLLSTIFGAGAIGLRALATGIPASILAGMTNPKTARADTPAPVDAGPVCNKPQYIYLLTSGSGDPLNANVPGTYEDPGVYHPADPQMAPTPMTFGSQTVNAALPWANPTTGLRAEWQSRIAFFHHGTYTNSHGDAAKVNRVMGAVQRQEMLVSLFAKSLGPCLGTVQQQPIVLSSNLITFDGAVMPILAPQSLQAVLLSPTGGLLNLQKIRDTHLDQLNALMKQSGNTAQKAILDQYALSQQEARSLSQDLLNDLASINSSSRQNLNTAAAVLFKMNVSPVMVAGYSFGGDNHGDANLAGETSNHVASIQGLNDLYDKLAKYNLQDQVTIAMQNVFGRTMNIKAHEGNADGRNHNANHHCSVLIGAGFKRSLIGGCRLSDNGYDYQAMGITSSTGAANDSGDITYENTFASVAKTFGQAVGVDPSVLNDQITSGTVIPAALA